MLQQILELLALAATATFEDVKKKIDEWKNAASVVTAKYKAAMNELGLKDDASQEDVKAFALKHNTILQELGVKAADTVEQIKQVIVAAKSTQQPDLKNYVLKSDFDAVQLQLKTRDFEELVAKHTKRGALLPNEIEDFKKDVMENKISCKDLNDRLAKRADYSLVPLQEIDAKNNNSAASGLDANTIEIAASMGVSKVDLEKYGK